MKTKLCLPIQATTIHAVLADIRRAKKYDMVEVWLSCINHLTLSDVKRIITSGAGRLILVLRPPQDLHTALTPSLIKDIIRLCNHHRILVDVDLKTQNDLLKKTKREIISFHDFHRTPSLSVLRKIINDMQTFHPSICKIATMCKTPRDALTLMALLLELRKKRIPCVILGMGEAGKITRITGSLWGNEVLYAPITKSGRSAPGQLTQKEIQIAMRILRKE